MNKVNNQILEERIMQVLNVFQRLKIRDIHQILQENEGTVNDCINKLTDEGKIAQDSEKHFIGKTKNDLKMPAGLKSKDRYWGVYRFGNNRVHDFFNYKCPVKGVFLLCLDDAELLLLDTDASKVDLGISKEASKLN